MNPDSKIRLLFAIRRKDFAIGETQQRLSLCFLNPGSGPGTESRLSMNRTNLQDARRATGLINRP